MSSFRLSVDRAPAAPALGELVERAPEGPALAELRGVERDDVTGWLTSFRAF